MRTLLAIIANFTTVVRSTDHRGYRGTRGDKIFEKRVYNQLDNGAHQSLASRLEATNGERIRINELTPYEEQVVVSWQQVVKRFPLAFEAQAQDRPYKGEVAVASPPFISLGFAKTGSTSLNHFLRCAGNVRSCHYFLPNEMGQIADCLYKADQDGKPMLQSCGYPQYCGGYTQMEHDYLGLTPQVDKLELMVQEEPNATLIFPFRNFERWVRSQNAWSIKHAQQNMIDTRDNRSPYFGFDAFDSMHPKLGGERIQSFSKRQKEQQLLFLEKMQGSSGHFDRESRTILRRLGRLRGHDANARLALFMVFYVTFVRQVVAQHPSLKYIEYNLEDFDRSGDLLSSAFGLNQAQRNRCWRKQNVTPANTTAPASVQ